MNISGAPAEVEMVIQIKRADTGVVEEHKLVGFVNPEQKEVFEQMIKENQNGSDA